LRLGYVGADLRRNPVGYFLEAVLANHDPSQVEVFLFANQAVNDDLTDRLVQHAQHWRKVIGFGDDALAKIIRDDQIDILIDLSGHTGKHRLLTFARKPAPIQATWMGYFATTGMAAIDYILADRFVIPPQEESQYVERVLRLPESYLCFTPPDVSFDKRPLEVGPLPAKSRGYVTFGCFNNLTKITLDVLKVWAQILKAVPDSRLFLKYKPLADAGTRDYFRNRLSDLGIDPHRIRLEASSPRGELLAAYNQVDIGLDPFPFNGGTTTAEALWMGVPVVTLRGDRFVSHVGETFLTTAGQADLVTNTADEYIARTVALASDLPALAVRRARLRAELLGSPLCDGATFTRGLEAALRDAWRRWCGTETEAHSDHT
jgi:predicted O-linked N-acetylglucosamine transferase (SPINDLY family)